MQPIKQLVLKFLFVVVSLAITSVIAEPEDNAQKTLEPFYAQYKGYRYGVTIGEASMQLESMGDKKYKLSYKSKASLFFLTDKRSEISLFRLSGNSIVPLKYTFRRKGTGKDKGVDVEFDDQNRRIHIDKQDTFAWQGEFDNQLFRLDIQRRLAKGEKQFAYKLINDRGQLREYKLQVIGKEQLDLPYGKLEGIKVEIIREKQNRRKTLIWFSPELDYQLVRLQQFKDGEEQGDIRLSHFQTKS